MSMQIGQSANLLFGYASVWNPNGSIAYPFFAPPTQAVDASAPKYVAPSDDGWSAHPTITLHETPEGFLDGLHRYRVSRLAADPAGVEVPVGALALHDHDASQSLADLGDFVGLDLTNENQFYMLVTLERVSGVAQHAFTSDPSAVDRSEHLTAAAKKVIDQLTPAQPPKKGNVLYDSKLTQRDASSYVDAIYSLGSHFVSEIVEGDTVFQVFAYDKAKFQSLRKIFDRESTKQPDGTRAVTGRTADAWSYYTSKLDGQFGFVSSYGDLACLSRDSKLAGAVADGKWKDGHVPDGTPSIFAGVNDNRLLQPLQEKVPVGLTLTPLAALVRNQLVAGPFDRLVKGGLLQKFGESVHVPLARQLDVDWSELFPEAIESWAAELVTPTIDIYQERVDLAKVNLRGLDLVKDHFSLQSFTSFSQVLQATTAPGDSAITLPSDDITLVAQIIDMTQAVQTPVIRMSASAFENFEVYCEDMYGSLIFEDDTVSDPGRKTALDGFLFATSSQPDAKTNRYKVELAGVFSDRPGDGVVGRLKQSIQFSLVAGESLLHSKGPKAEEIRGLEISYLLWLASIIPSDTKDADLAHNRARALYLAHEIDTFGSDVVYVPYVTYETYSKYVGDLVSQASTLNGEILGYQGRITTIVSSYKVLDSIDNLNYNIKQIGGVLTSYFKALADGRRAMNGYYDSVIQQLEKELKETLDDIKTLQGKLEDQQTTISSTSGSSPGIVQKFEKDYADYSKDLVAQFVMDGVQALFSLGLSLGGIPAASDKSVLDAMKAIKDAVDKLQAVMKVLKQLSAIEKAVDNIDKLNQLADTISLLGAQGKLQLPTQVELKAMAEHVQAALTNVPDKGSLQQDKADLIAAVRTLVIIGTALIEAQVRASQILVEVANQNRLKTVNGDQDAQLAALAKKLHLKDTQQPPDVASIDLIGVSGQLQFQLKQVLKILAEVLELQNGAIQYEYFGEPTPISSFTLINLQSVISTQDSKIINALQQLNPPPQKVTQPIKVVVKDVLASRLSGGNVFQFPIHLCSTEFYDYDMVRIDRVVPSIRGIKSTKTGKYEVHLSCQAKPFQDRDYQRNPRTFASALRKFGPYVYEVDSGKATFGANTGTFADQVTHLTPFAQWEISLPDDVKNNQDIEFDHLLVDVEMEFHVKAHYDDPASRHQAMVEAVAEQYPELAAAATTDGSQPSLPNLDLQMYNNQAVLQDWDAVFNVLSGPVNAYLNQQFQEYIQKIDPATSDNLMPVDQSYCDGIQTVAGIWFTNVTRMEFKLSNPLLQFIPGNDSVTVVQDIFSGSIQQGTLQVTEKGFNPEDCRLPKGSVPFTADSGSSTLSIDDDYFSNNMVVKLTTSGSLPSPLETDTKYWIVGRSESSGKTTLKLSDSAKGSAIDLTDDGTGTQSIEADVSWSPRLKVDTSKNPYIKASVALKKVAGVVKPNTHTVVVDFPKGAFVLNKFEVDPPKWDPGHHASEISTALADFFATHEVEYRVQTIDYSNLAKDKDLTPSQFVLNAANTNAGNNVLQILIVTSGSVQHAHTITLNEPVAYDPANPVAGVSAFSTSLMIGTKLMFAHIFVDSFNRGGTNIQVEGVDSGKNFEAWSAKITQGSATGTVNFKNPYYPGGTKTEFRISASSNDLSWSLEGLTFKRTRGGGLDLHYSNGDASVPTGGRKVDFEYRQWIQPGGRFHPPPYWSDWYGASAIAYVTLTGNYPLEVTGDGTDQLVKFSTDVPKVTATKASDLKPTAACECNDNDLKIALLGELSDAVPETLKKYMQQITFKPISVMALESLLFPAGQLVSIGEARVPGDLLVVGSFLGKVRKKTTDHKYDVTIYAAAGSKGSFGSDDFQNGQGTGSVTKTNMVPQITFEYGPIDSSLGPMKSYDLNFETGTVNDLTLIFVVVQPDPDQHPEKVLVLPQGYPPTGTGS